MHSFIANVRPNAYKNFTKASYAKWSMAHFPADSYNDLTSNSAESINSLSQKAHKLRVAMLMEENFFKGGTMNEVSQDLYVFNYIINKNIKF